MLEVNQLLVEVGEDFSEYARIIARERPEQPLGLPFDPNANDLSGGKAACVIARNFQGELVHTQAMRLIDLGEQSLANYLREGFRDFPPSGVPIDYKESVYNAGPGA